MKIALKYRNGIILLPDAHVCWTRTIGTNDRNINIWSNHMFQTHMCVKQPSERMIDIQQSTLVLSRDDWNMHPTLSPSESRNIDDNNRSIEQRAKPTSDRKIDIQSTLFHLHHKFHYGTWQWKACFHPGTPGVFHPSLGRGSIPVESRQNLCTPSSIEQGFQTICWATSNVPPPICYCIQQQQQWQHSYP